MKRGVSCAISLGIALAWLADVRPVVAQGTYAGCVVHRYGTIVQTVWYLTDTNLIGFFGSEGVPVFSAGPWGPYSTLSVDLNHDGLEDYRVVATGTVTFGFQMEGVGSNAVWARPVSAGIDFDYQIVPLPVGTEIGSVLPGQDEWALTEVTPFGVAGPYFSSYSSIGAIGMFIDKTAYVGLRFYIGADVHYGWIKVQEVPWMCGGGIVYEYAYDIRPGMPVYAGVVPEPPALSLLVLSLLLIAGGMRSRVSTRSNYVCPK